MYRRAVLSKFSGGRPVTSSTWSVGAPTAKVPPPDLFGEMAYLGDLKGLEHTLRGGGLDEHLCWHVLIPHLATEDSREDIGEDAPGRGR